MAIAELVLKYLQVLAWPIVILIAVSVFRRQLVGLFARITEASMFGATVKLEESAERAVAKSESMPELSDPGAKSELLAKPEPAEKVKSPEADAVSMIGAWVKIETLANSIGGALGLHGALGRSVPRVMNELSERELISPEALSVAKELQSVRNQLVHGAPGLELSNSVAQNFVEAAEQLRVALTVALGRIYVHDRLESPTAG